MKATAIDSEEVYGKLRTYFLLKGDIRRMRLGLSTGINHGE